MNARPPRLLLALLVLPTLVCLTASSSRAEPVDASSRVVGVTVYQGQALVTREVELPADEGLLELIVGDLPAGIVPGSLYAEPGGTVEVRSVRYRQRPVEADTREEVQQLDEAIQEVADEMASVKKRFELLKSRSGYLASLEKFTSGTASSELEHGVLNADTLEQLTDLVFDRRAEIAEEELNLGRLKRELEERMDLLRRERETLTGAASRTLREAVVFLNVPEQNGSALRLTYLVSGATWSPSYNLRANEERTRVVVEYNASVQQMSGEDWNDVQMILSTATPSLVATAPKLDPLSIRLAAIQRAKTRSAGREELFERQQKLAQNRGSFMFAQPNAPASEAEAASGVRLFADGSGGGGGFGGAYVGDQLANAVQADVGLNELADELMLCDINCPTPQVVKPSSKRGKPSTEGLSVVYRLENPTSLPSRSDRQLIQIASMPIEAEFYRVASPSLTSYVYEEARLTNNAGKVLLAGPAATFLGDRFVGRGQVPSVSVGESFTVGLGIDESLRVSRELVERSENVQGGNRVASFDYRLAIENFGEEAVEVRLYDRLPQSEGADIKVQLVKSDPVVSDSEADAARRKEGILRWDLEVAAGAIGTESAEVTYTMQLEHDKNLSIVGMPEKK